MMSKVNSIKKEAAAEKMKLAQELSELNKVNEELEVEDKRLIESFQNILFSFILIIQ